MKKTMKAWVIFLLFGLALPAQAASGKAEGTARSRKERGRAVYHDEPRVRVSLASRYFFLDGKTRAREFAKERYYPSQDMHSLDVRDDLGVSDMVMTELGLELRLSPRNRISLRYLRGETEGEGRIGYSTGFNDHYFPGPDKTDGALYLESVQADWSYRLLERGGEFGLSRLDLAAGVLSLRTYTSFRTQNSGLDLETEDMLTPFIPYVAARGEWAFANRIQAGADLTAGPVAIESPLLTEIPGHGNFYGLDLYATYQVKKWMDFTVGANFWNLEVDVDRVETNHRNHYADNETELWMQGAYVALSFSDPHTSAVSALRSFFARR